MAQETGVERLDYSKPPPGYDGLESPREYLVASSWAHYKLKHDPPGMHVWQTVARQGHIVQGVWVFSLTGVGAAAIDWHLDPGRARAAAWAWHDRRHALSLRDEARLGFPIFTMAGYLALTDAQVQFADLGPPVCPEISGGVDGCLQRVSTSGSRSMRRRGRRNHQRRDRQRQPKE